MMKQRLELTEKAGDYGKDALFYLNALFRKYDIPENEYPIWEVDADTGELRKLLNN